MESREPQQGGPAAGPVSSPSAAGLGPAPPGAPGHTLPAVRVATLADVGRIVAIHLATLPSNLSDFTPLGVPVVTRFYENLITRGLGTLLVSTDGDVVAGFTLITPDVHDCMHGTLLGGPADVFFLLTRARLDALLRAFLGGTGQVPHVAELVYLGVDGACRSRGHGRALLLAAEEEFRRRGLRGFQLNVMADNVRAIRLYESCGFTVSRHFSRRGAPMLTMSRAW